MARTTPAQKPRGFNSNKVFPSVFPRIPVTICRPLESARHPSLSDKNSSPSGCKPAHKIPTFRVHDPHCGDTTKVLKKNREGQRKPKKPWRLAATRPKSGLIGQNPPLIPKVEIDGLPSKRYASAFFRPCSVPDLEPRGKTYADFRACRDLHRSREHRCHCPATVNERVD